jgi:hypothetical protein
VTNAGKKKIRRFKKEIQFKEKIERAQIQQQGQQGSAY